MTTILVGIIAIGVLMLLADLVVALARVAVAGVVLLAAGSVLLAIGVEYPGAALMIACTVGATLLAAYARSQHAEACRIKDRRQKLLDGEISFDDDGNALN